MKNEKNLEEKWKEYNLDYAKDHEKENPDIDEEFRAILKIYTPDTTKTVLEIGCNTGEFCYLLKNKYNLKPEGIDINVEAIKIAKKKYKDINFKVENFFNHDGKYDIIYMQHVIEHIENPEKAFLKLKQLLNPEGKLIISCPNKWAYPTKLVCWIMKKKFSYDPTHVFEFNPKELSQMIEETGFNKLKVETKPFYRIPIIYRISRKIQSTIPNYHLYGDSIFILAEKP